MGQAKQDPTWEATRKRVLDRDGHACRFCDMSEDEHQEKHDQGLHAHHVLPRNAGGEDVPENLITVCVSCHQTIESAHADAVEEHVNSENDGDDFAISVRKMRERWEEGLRESEQKINSYLRRHPSIQRNQGMVDADDWYDLHFPPKYEPSFGDVGNGEFKIESEYDFFLSLGFRAGLMEAFIDIDNGVGNMINYADD